MSTLSRVLSSTLIALVCLASSIQTASANPKADQDLKNALDRAGLNYSITERGDFKLVYNLDGGREHTVYIRVVG